MSLPDQELAQDRSAGTSVADNIQVDGAAMASKVTFDAAACAGRDSLAKGLPEEAAEAGVSEMPAKGLLPALAGAFPSAGAASDTGSGAGAAPRLALKIFRFLMAVLSARAKPSPTWCTAYRLFRNMHPEPMRTHCITEVVLEALELPVTQSDGQDVWGTSLRAKGCEGPGPTSLKAEGPFTCYQAGSHVAVGTVGSKQARG